jgi:ABC-type cobalt transport system substrate-binding protein
MSTPIQFKTKLILIFSISVLCVMLFIFYKTQYIGSDSGGNKYIDNIPNQEEKSIFSDEIGAESVNSSGSNNSFS